MDTLETSTPPSNGSTGEKTLSASPAAGVPRTARAAIEILKVSATSKPVAVAGAIAGVVRSQSRVEVQAIGAGAINQAVKAIAISRGYVAAGGFSAVADPDQADLAILVTCSVRQNAEQKAYGRFRELKAWKRARPGRAIAMTGCMANKEKDRLYERLPDLDYRFDMRQYEAFIEDLQGEYETDPAQTGGVVLQHGLTAYVPVIFGCNEVCSFCIVPFVRGTERSRPLQDVVDDVRRFADQGVREVTLLGQTVNSYRDPDTKAGLAALLEAVERVPGIWRVRFLTSHPRHVHDALLFAIRDLPRVW